MKKTRWRIAAAAMLFSLLAAYAFTADRTSHKTYLKPDECDLTLFVSQPPVDNSAQTRSEIEEILRFQSNRTKDMSDFARADQELSVFRFADVLGPGFKKENLPVTDRFFYNVVENAKDIIEVYKKYWKRPRPYILDSRVDPCVDKPANDSYPSGHSTIGNLIATILAGMVPSKNGELYRRGWNYALNRIIGGVHYRSDVEAGRICAAVIAEGMYRNPEFKHDFEAAKAELRTVLSRTNLSAFRYIPLFHPEY